MYVNSECEAPLKRNSMGLHENGVPLILSVLERAFLLQFPRHRCIMVSLEYLPYNWKLFNHMGQLYTLGVGKFSHILKFDL